MTPALRTAILDALMERWRKDVNPTSVPIEEPLAPLAREHFAACLDMILPVAEPMIREATMRELQAILALGEPK